MSYPLSQDVTQMPTADVYSTTSKLKAADQAAQSQSSARGVEDRVQPCPLVQRFAIESIVLGEDDKPLMDVAVELRKSPTAVLRDKTGADGMVRFESLEAGSYQLSLYELDKDAWELVNTGALPNSKSEGDATWQIPTPPSNTDEFEHTVVQGECTAKLAYQFGFFTGTIWDWPANTNLKKDRGDKYVLYPTDKLVIPALRNHHLACATGERYTLRRRGVPEKLNIQFLIADEPRANIDYHLSLRTLSGKILKDEAGQTTTDGRVKAWIHPDTYEAAIQLMEDGDEEDYIFAISSLDPVHEDSGAFARLAGLGFFVGLIDDGNQPHREEAVKLFQRSVELTVTGKLDGQTIAKLDDAYNKGE